MTSLQEQSIKCKIRQAGIKLTKKQISLNLSELVTIKSDIDSSQLSRQIACQALTTAELTQIQSFSGLNYYKPHSNQCNPLSKVILHTNLAQPETQQKLPQKGNSLRRICVSERFKFPDVPQIVFLTIIENS